MVCFSIVGKYKPHLTETHLGSFNLNVPYKPNSDLAKTAVTYNFFSTEVAFSSK